MPGWQIALIAAGAALLAATVAVLAYRAWSTRRKTITARRPPEPWPGPPFARTPNLRSR